MYDDLTLSLVLVDPCVPEPHCVATLFMVSSSALLMFGIVKYIYQWFVKDIFTIL
jgi:hypothetical protein